MNDQPETQKTKEEKENIEQIIKEKTISYVVAAFGLVAGLAWNEAVKALIEFFFPASGNSLIAKFFYALILTVALVVISVYLSRLIKKSDNSNNL